MLRFPIATILLLNAAVLTVLLVVEPPLPGDFIAYRVASELFWQGKNPYDHVQLLAHERSYAPHLDAPSSVWNPPLFFVSLALPYAFPLAVAKFLVPLLALNATIGVALLALAMTRSSSFAGRWVLLLVPASYPLWVDLFLGQFSAVLGFSFFLAATLFLRRRDTLGGVAIALIIIKPHLLWLPAALLGVWAIHGRRFTFIASAVGTALGLSALAEAINPGITAAWIGRHHWPTTYYGSTMGSVLTGVFHLTPLAPVIAIACSLLFAVAVGFGFRDRLFPPRSDALAAATACTHFFSPYGFAFDQVGVLFYFCYVISSCPPSLAQRIAAFYFFQFALANVLMGTMWGSIDLSWLIPELSALVLLVIRLRTATFPPTERPPGDHQTDNGTLEIPERS